MAWRGACLALAILGGAGATVTAWQASAPTTAPSQTVRPIAAAALQTDAFVNRVWVVGSPSDIPAGAFYVFLANGVLVISKEQSKPAFGSWAETADGLVMVEDGLSYKVDVLELNASRFRIRVSNPGRATEITLVPAVARPDAPAAQSTAAATATPKMATGPLPTAYRCGADVYGVAFQSGKAYITLPDGQLVVMDEVTVKDAPASRRTFSGAGLTFVEDTSEAYTRVLFARAGLRPRPCSSLR
jgi:hypothetical protein